MTLVRALHSEVLKMKGTIALKMVILAPALVFLLMLVAFSQAPRSPHDLWLILEQSTLDMWALLAMPLYITLQTALVAGLDHTDNQWKSLLARPVPRWTLYVAKLVVVMAMAAASAMVLLCGIFMDGAILRRVRPGLHFGFPAPWGEMFAEAAQVAMLAFLALTIQHWVSLRWRSFSVAVGIGIAATILGGFAFGTSQQFVGWLRYFPWALPMLPLGRQAHPVGMAILISTAAGLVVVACGCFGFCRREVN
jgi:hypothetical protein